MGVVNFLMKFLVPASDAVRGLDLQTDAYYRLSSAGGQAVLRFQAMHEASQRLVSFWNSASVVLAAPGRIAQASNEYLRNSVQTYGDLEQALQQLHAQGGATASEMKSVRQTALEAAPEIGRSAAEIVNVSRQLRAAGLSGEQAEKMLAPILRFGTVYRDTDLSKIAETGIVGFQRFGDQIGYDADKLFEIYQNFMNVSRIDPENMLAFLNALKAAPITARGQLPTILAIGAALSLGGNQAAQVADQINILLRNLVNLDRQADQAGIGGNRFVARLKVTAREALNAHTFDAGKMRSLIDILADIDKAMAGMDEQSSQYQLMNAFRSETTGTIKLLQQLKIDTAAYPEILGNVEQKSLDSAEAVDFLGKTIFTTSGRLKQSAEDSKVLPNTIEDRLVQAINVLSTTIGERAAPALNTWREAQIKVLGWIDKGIQKLDVFGAGIAATAYGLGSVIEKVSYYAQSVTSIIMNLLAIQATTRWMTNQAGGGGGGVAGVAGSVAGGAAQGAIMAGTGSVMRSALGGGVKMVGGMVLRSLLGMAGLAVAGGLAYGAYKFLTMDEVDPYGPEKVGAALGNTTPKQAAGVSGGRRDGGPPIRISVQSTGNIDGEKVMDIMKHEEEIRGGGNWQGVRNVRIGY